MEEIVKTHNTSALHLEKSEANLIVNDLDLILKKFQDIHQGTIDIILDNAGMRDPH